MSKASPNRSPKLMELANEEAQRFNHDYIGTEHILLGMLLLQEGVAAQILKKHGIAYNPVKDFITKGPALVVNSGPEVDERLPFTPLVKRVIDLAVREAQFLGHNEINYEHVLLGLLSAPDCVAAEILSRVGLTYDQVREDVVGFHQAPEADAVFTLPDDLQLALTSRPKTNGPGSQELDDEIEQVRREMRKAIESRDYKQVSVLLKRLRELQKRRAEIRSAPEHEQPTSNDPAPANSMRRSSVSRARRKPR
jgi:hypothetical protein